MFFRQVPQTQFQLLGQTKPGAVSHQAKRMVVKNATSWASSRHFFLRNSPSQLVEMHQQKATRNPVQTHNTGLAPVSDHKVSYLVIYILNKIYNFLNSPQHGDYRLFKEKIFPLYRKQVACATHTISKPQVMAWIFVWVANTACLSRRNIFFPKQL